MIEWHESNTVARSAGQYKLLIRKRLNFVALVSFFFLHVFSSNECVAQTLGQPVFKVLDGNNPRIIKNSLCFVNANKIGSTTHYGKSDKLFVEIKYSAPIGTQNKLYVELTPEISSQNIVVIGASGSRVVLPGRSTSVGSISGINYKTMYFYVPFGGGTGVIQMHFSYGNISTGRDSVGINFDLTKGPPGSMYFLHVPRSTGKGCVQI